MLHYWRIERIGPALRTPAFRALLVRLPVSTAVLAAYWLALFVATHMPVHVARGTRLPSDKLIHFVSYGLLASLIGWTISGRSPLTFNRFLVVFGLVAAYGAVDELTQSLVPSRSADLADWFADATGAALGLFIYAAVSRLMSVARKKTARS